jgi:hypothetical protein
MNGLKVKFSRALHPHDFKTENDVNILPAISHVPGGWGGGFSINDRIRRYRQDWLEREGMKEE